MTREQGYIYQILKRLANPDVTRRASRRYYRKHRERILEIAVVDRAKNHSANAMYASLWRYVFPEKERIAQGVQRCRRRGATIQGDRKAIKAVYARCRELKQHFDVVVDHIIPIRRGGLHCADNLQIIYGLENRRKHARLDYLPRVVFR